jgi:hypothetical protein
MSMAAAGIARICMVDHLLLIHVPGASGLGGEDSPLLRDTQASLKFKRR